ncbi:alpha/beta hydrolase fold domain-containing protein [Microbacterium sp. ASV49]|uniref:Alpha/beta hydrolase n=1 Tax=Microbacterium candidum TaxID=3041922 RepID=A0ABT7MVG8_9MICO|nr:alpha/beta hydrolase [Microbacterium sp. ASV49]MDL9978437.1 alpha/beta hydrolase [Microbacterium sp. ASV49]
MTVVALDPAILAWAELHANLTADVAAVAPDDWAGRRAAMLRMSDLLAEEVTLPVPDGVAIDDVWIEGPGGPLRMRRYRPDGLPRMAPTQLVLHGGGFLGGTVDEILNDRLCAARAKDAGIQVCSLEYRLAPEHPYPAAALDAVAAVGALAIDPTLGADPVRIGIGGNSAGATIAASAALMIRDAGDDVLIHQDLEVPAASLLPFGESFELYGQGYGVDDAASLVGVYVGGSDIPPGASPLEVEDLSGLPPTSIFVAEFDPLRDGGIAYAERLTEAGVDVDLVVGAGHVHGSLGLTRTFAAARDTFAAHTRMLAAVYHP